VVRRRGSHNQIDLGLDENEAFEKIKAGLRHAIEACRQLDRGEGQAFAKMTQGIRDAIEGATEISTYRTDPQWMLVSLAFEKMLKNVNDLNASVHNRILSGDLSNLHAVNPQWRVIRMNLRKMFNIVNDLHKDAAVGFVQGFRN
jgi:hypothetical protein